MGNLMTCQDRRIQTIQHQLFALLKNQDFPLWKLGERIIVTWKQMNVYAGLSDLSKKKPAQPVKEAVQSTKTFHH